MKQTNTETKTHYTYLERTITDFFDEKLARKNFDKNEKSKSKLTFCQAEQMLCSKLDQAVKQIGVAEIREKIKEFKRNCFFYYDDNEGKNIANIAGLEGLESCYIQELARVFGYGSH